MKPDVSKDIQEHIFVFYNLLVVILKRRALFRAFERSLINKGLTEEEVEGNDFVSYYITDYNRGQLIDLRKFFETDDSSYKISELVSYIKVSPLSDEHRRLYKIWKTKFADQVNKLIAHIDKDSSNLAKEVKKEVVDNFINAADAFLSQLIKELRTKGTLILQDELRDPNGYFLKIEPNEVDFEEYLKWASG